MSISDEQMQELSTLIKETDGRNVQLRILLSHGPETRVLYRMRPKHSQCAGGSALRGASDTAV
jgi:hypothetical protein